MLPLKATGSLAVVGPHAVSKRDLLSDYIIDQLCYKGPIRGGDCWPSIGEAFTNMHTGGTVTVEKGVDMNTHNTGGIAAAVAAAEAADSVVLCIGIGNEQEHEGVDRKDTLLPGIQSKFAQKILALGKPTVVILVNGGIVSIDELVPDAHAIVEAFYPSTRGAEALYMQLTGLTNSWSKLPVTIYPAEYTKQVEL